MIRRLSLRGRLLLAVGAIVVVALAIADVSVYASFRSYLFGSTDAALEAAHVPLQAEAVNPADLKGALRLPPIPRGITFSSSLFCAIGREGAPGMFIEVRSAKGAAVNGAKCLAYVAGSKSYEPAIPKVITGFEPDKSQFGQLTAYFTTTSTVSKGPAFRVRASRLSDGNLLLVAQPISGVASSLRRLLALEALITIVVLLAAIALGRALVLVGLRPLRDVERTANAITAGDLAERIPVENPRSEVGHVATALNVMLERIHETVTELSASENRSRRFVADASHELRTPLAAVSAYAQAFQQGAAQDPDDLARVIDGIGRESARMIRLVEDLLLLARLDEHELVESEPIELVGLVAEAIDTALAVTSAWSFHLDADEAVEVIGDRVALRQIIDNLLSNVRAHTPPGTTATVRVTSDLGDAIIEVSDEGPGLDEKSAVAVFERFFRADTSRARATGGSGLGLAIVAAIAAAHGGRVEAHPHEPSGVSFTVYLPLAAPSPTTTQETASPTRDRR